VSFSAQKPFNRRHSGTKIVSQGWLVGQKSTKSYQRSFGMTPNRNDAFQPSLRVKMVEH